MPIKTVGTRWVTVGDIGEAKDASQLQYNIVRVDGQKSAYIPIMKQGGDTNTIEVVDGVRNLIGHLFDIPKQLKAAVVFDQSVFVKEAIKTVLHEGIIGLVLTSLMILIFLGSMRATFAVLLSIPISALATFVILYMMGSTVNTMILGGLALAFSRVIDNSVISLENIYRHLEMGVVAGGGGGGRRRGSQSGSARRDPGRRGGFLPGHVPVRRQQVSVLRAGAGVLSVAAGVVRGGDDGDSAVLLQIPEGRPPRAAARVVRLMRPRPRRKRSPGAAGSTPGSTGCSTTCWISTSGGCGAR